MNSRSIFVCRYGGWSHINRSFFSALREKFPDHAWQEIDYEAQVLRGNHAWRLMFWLTAGLVYQKRLRALLKRPGLLRYEWRDASLLTSFAFRQGNRLTQKYIHRLADGKPPLFVLQTGSRYSAKIPGVPHFIYTDHTHLANLQYPSFNPGDLNNRDWIAEERSLYKQATSVFTLSENIRRSLLDDYGVSSDHCKTVGAGFNMGPSNEWLPTRDWGRKEILFVGTEWERKGGPMLLNAFRQLQQHHPDAKLTIVGCNPRIDAPNVEIAGFVPLKEVSAYFSRATVFCMPSRQEPFGIVYLEAMAYGLPVIAASIGALPEIVDHAATGYLIKDNDLLALKDTLRSLLDDPAKLQALGDQGRQKALREHRWDLVASRTKNEIENHLQKHQLTENAL